jgi:EAL domain-containing protein (putative c-di-GMP-specific phosphodiesterase class I)
MAMTEMMNPPGTARPPDPSDRLAALIPALLSAVRQRFGIELVVLSETVDGRRVLRALEGDRTIGLNALPPVDDEGGDETPYLIHDSAAHQVEPVPSWAGRQSPTASCVVVPLRLPSGRPYGALYLLSREPLGPLERRDTHYLSALATVLTEHLSGVVGVVIEDHLQTAQRIHTVLIDDILEMVGQPIVDLGTTGIVGYEALARFTGHPDRTPAAWFQDAARVGLGIDLELKAIRRGLSRLPDLPDTAFISLNISPECAASSELRETLDSAPLDRVVLEITEHAHVESYMALNRALLPLRIKGVQIAIDDAGAGFASLRHILHLQPDMIKLDGSWVAEIEADAARRALITAVVGFARDLNASVVGEAIETPGQAMVLRDLGVDCGQGYHFGRPGPIEPGPGR